MATPHVNSVIDTTINQRDSVLYDQLIQMETYTYDNSTQFEDFNEIDYAGVTEYQPFWQQLSDGLVSYFQYIDQEITRQTLQEFIIALYGFLFYFEVYGYGEQSKKDESNAFIFLQYTFIIAIKNYPIDHYDDYQYTTNSAPNLESDINATNVQFPFTTLKTHFSTVAMEHANNAVFGNSPEPKGNFDPQIAWDIIFKDLEWKDAIELLDIDYTVLPRP